jgi:hypothetical protein
MKASQLLTSHTGTRAIFLLAKSDTVATEPSRHNMNITAALHKESDTLPQTGRIPELSWTQWW